MKNTTYSLVTANEIIRLLEEPTEDRRPLKYSLQREAPVKELVKALWMSNTVLTSRILCDILGARRARTAIPALLNCLTNPDPSLKNDAAEALGKIGDPKAGEQILKHFINEPRLWFAAALGAIGYRPAIPYLLSALNSNLENVRGGAAWSLGVMKVTDAQEALMNALKIEKDQYALDRIQEALDRIGEEGTK